VRNPFASAIISIKPRCKNPPTTIFYKFIIHAISKLPVEAFAIFLNIRYLMECRTATCSKVLIMNLVVAYHVMMRMMMIRQQKKMFIKLIVSIKKVFRRKNC